LIELARRPCTQLSDLAREYRVCGAQLAIQHRDEIVTAETGVLECGNAGPVTSDSAFPIGSITKAFTATLAMTMVADGDADLDQPLGGLVPELGDLGGLLTLRRLLSHTAGLACGPDSAELSSASLRRYAADHCAERNLVHPPGAGFSYSNLGYVLVGRVIEVLTGMTWPDAVESILLEPLGIEPTFIQPAVPTAPPRALATGHSVTADPQRTRPVRQSLAPAEAPAGALAASARDLLELGRLHVPPGSPWLLPPEQAQLMRDPVPEADPFGLADGWGLGLAVFRGPGSDWAGHDGNGDGTSCHLRVDPVDGWAVALTTNTSTGTALWRRLCNDLAEAGIPLPDPSQPAVPAGPAQGDAPAGSPLVDAPAGQPRAEAPAGSAQPRSLPAECAGTYANGDSEYVVTGPGGRADGPGGRADGPHGRTDGPDGRADGHCTLSFGGTDFELLACAGDLTARGLTDSDLTFALLDRSSGQRLPGGRFQRDPVTGRITGMQVSGRVARRIEAGER
jgi:CubicO group peptidase (beta-lactamase class C family)